MALVPPEQQASIADLFRATSDSIDGGVVASSHRERKRYWQHWRAFIREFDGVDPYLFTIKRGEKVPLPTGRRVDLLGAFATRVRLGTYRVRKGDRSAVRCATVQVALRAIGTTFELDGLPNPTYRSEGRYWKKLERQLEDYRRRDPPATPKLAVPVSVVNHLIDAAACSKSPKKQAEADMCLIAFYYLLRVGEYTGHRKSELRRTKQFRACDVTFWDKTHTIIPNTAPLKRLYQAESATLKIDNQKNGVRGATVNHTALHLRRCPVRAVARRVHHIMTHSKSNSSPIISTYFDKKGVGKPLQSNHINHAIKNAVKALSLDKKGFPPRSVSSHSLRAGGAMAMHLNDVPRDTIRKMGRWSSDTFLMYIHEQISALSNGLSKTMSTEIGWHNIEGPSTSGLDQVS